MADLNITYDGYVENLVRPQIKECKGFSSPFGCIGPEEWVDAWEPEDLTQWRNDFNAKSPATVNAVKVPYQQGQDRKAWLLERIDAVSKRAKLISERCQPFRVVLIEKGAQSTEEKFGVVLTNTVPFVGPVLSKVLSSAITEGNVEAFVYAQTLIGTYTQDLSELGKIRAQLIKEYEAIGETTPAPDKTLQPGNEAPNPNANYYWIGGAVVLLFFLLWLKNRRKRR